MFDRLISVATAVVTASAAVTAQVPAPLTGPSHALARARASHADAAARFQAGIARLAELPVVATYGGLRLRMDTADVPSGIRAFIDDELGRVFAVARGFAGPAADSLLTGGVATVSRERRVLGTADGQYVFDLINMAFTHNGETRSFTMNPALPNAGRRIAAWLNAYVGDALAEPLSEELRRWGIGGLLGPPWAHGAREMTYRGLALSRSPSARACIEGALLACRTALAIGVGSDSIGAWFDAQARRALVAARDSAGLDRSVQAARRSCLTEQADADCRAVLARLHVRGPTGRESRLELLRIALLHGGPAAYGRLIASRDSSLAHQLEVAGGAPLDTLIAEWLTQVKAGQPSSPAPLAGEWLLGGLSILVLMGLGARLGTP